jgi:hypothetical protein
MSREILDSVWSASGIRLIGDGVPAGDVMAAQASLTHWDEWFPYWTGLGDTYERLAGEALARNRRQSAGELFWQACFVAPLRAVPLVPRSGAARRGSDAQGRALS